MHATPLELLLHAPFPPHAQVLIVVGYGIHARRPSHHRQGSGIMHITGVLREALGLAAIELVGVVTNLKGTHPLSPISI